MLNTKKQFSTVKQQRKNLKLVCKFSFTATFLHLSYVTTYFKNTSLNTLKQLCNYVMYFCITAQYSTRKLLLSTKMQLNIVQQQVQKCCLILCRIF